MLFVMEKLHASLGGIIEEEVVANQYGSGYGTWTFSFPKEKKSYTIHYKTKLIEGVEYLTIPYVISPKLSGQKIIEFQEKLYQFAKEHDLLAPRELENCYLSGGSIIKNDPIYHTYAGIHTCPKVSTESFKKLAMIKEGENTFEYFFDNEGIYELVNGEKITDSFSEYGIKKWWPEFEGGVVSIETGHFYRKVPFRNGRNQEMNPSECIPVFRQCVPSKHSKGYFVGLTSLVDWTDLSCLIEYLSDVRGETVKTSDLPKEFPYVIDVKEKEQSITVYHPLVIGHELVDVEIGDEVFVSQHLPYISSGRAVVTNVCGSMIRVEFDYDSPCSNEKKQVGYVKRKVNIVKKIESFEKQEPLHEENAIEFVFAPNGQLGFDF